MGVDAQGFPGGHLRLDPTFALCRASFLMIFATGGVPHSGPQQSPVAQWLRLSWELTLIEWLLTKSSEGVIVRTETQQWVSKIKYFIFEIKY